MEQLIDKIDTERPEKNSGKFNVLSLILLCFSLGILVYTVVVVRNDLHQLGSPWLPEYTPFFFHGALINFCVIQFIGFIPAIYLRWKKKYAASCYFLIGFLVLAKMLENQLEFYWRVYSIYQ